MGNGFMEKLRIGRVRRMWACIIWILIIVWFIDAQILNIEIEI